MVVAQPDIKGTVAEAHASAKDVEDGLVTKLERRGDGLADFFSEQRFTGMAPLAQQALRWAVERQNCGA